MTAPTLRDATLDDLPRLVHLLADDELGRTREEPGPPLPRAYVDAFHAIDADPHQRLVALVDGTEVVGCLQLSFLPGLSHRGAWRGQIEGVRVAASRRGDGLGRVLIAWAIEECRRHGCAMVQLTTTKTRTEARRFYERLGFTASHEGMKLALPEDPLTD